MERIEILREMLENQPDDAFLLFALAKEYEKLRDLERAVATYRQLEARHPDYLALYYHLGFTYMELDQLNAASKTLQKGHKIAMSQGDSKTAGEIKSLLQDLKERQD